MASVEIAIVVSIVVLVVVALIRTGPDHPLPVARAVVGIAAGAMGALVILTAITDLIPDGIEVWLTPIAVIAVTTALLVITVRSLAS